MSELWRKYYGELIDLVQSQPGIVIREDLISIEEAIRPAFYRKFNQVRSSFLAGRISESLDMAQFLSTKYMKVEDFVSERLRLEGVLMPGELTRFLADPFKQIIRDLFDPLFELLQEKIEPEEFEERADASVHESFRSLYQMGYIKWFVLSLIKNLDPEKAYDIPLPHPSSKELIKHREDIRQNIPFPQETKVLSFEIGRRDVLLIPDFIVRSAALEKYVAFRTAIGKAIWRATYHSERREWLSIGAIIEEYGITELKPDLLLYLDNNLEDVSLVADSEKFCRPDLSIFFLGQLGEDENQTVRDLERVRLGHEILKPIRKTCVISNFHVPDRMLIGLDENIEVIHFGFNNLKWERLLELLKA